MIIQPDFKELLQLLEKHSVEYMIVGGYAVAFHGYPRLTKDLDIFYRLTEKNVENLTSAFVEFGFSIEAVRASKLTDPGDLVAFGLPPVRVDLSRSSVPRNAAGDMGHITSNGVHALPIACLSC